MFFFIAEFWDPIPEPLLDLLTTDELIIEFEGIAIETIPPTLDNIKAGPFPEEDLIGN